jgi:diguanylate cyclase (GGDEF)-like protein/PAS domain S-box-containing protein
VRSDIKLRLPSHRAGKTELGDPVEGEAEVSALEEWVPEQRISMLGEAEHANSSELLALVLQGGNLGLWDLDVSSGSWTINDREAAMLGYTRESAHAEISDWKALVHPDELASLLAANKRHLAGETRFSESVHRLRHRAGHYIWVLDRSVVVKRDATGNPLRMVGTHMDVTDRKADDERQDQTIERLQLALSGGDIGLWDRDVRSGKTVYNDRWWEIFGVPLEHRHAVDGLWKSMVHPDDHEPARMELMRHIRGEAGTYEGTVRARHADGSYLWVTNRAKVVERSPDGEALRIVGITMNVTQSKAMEAALGDQQRRLKLITDSVPAIIMHIDCEERYTFVNAQFDRVFGIDSQEVIGKTLRETNTETVYNEIAPHVQTALRGLATSFEAVGPARGQMLDYQATYIPDVDEHGTVRGFFAMTYDITERKRTEQALIDKQQQLDALARTDTLTGLPNRRSIEEHTTKAIARTRRSKIPLAVMYLDVDHFKQVNDTYGHGGGDQVLREFGLRLKQSIRDTDAAARYAGDEFFICLEGLFREDDVSRIAEKIVASMCAPILIDGRAVSVTTSIGISIHRGGDENISQLSKRADDALYEAKAAGRNCFRVAARPAAEV